jgi:hypothetical protein
MSAARPWHGAPTGMSQRPRIVDESEAAPRASKITARPHPIPHSGIVDLRDVSWHERTFHDDGS